MIVPPGLQTFLDGRGRERLERFLVSRFPRLRSSADDVIQDVLLELLQSQETPKDAEDREQWFRFLCQRIRWRAIDRLRQIERHALFSLAQRGASDGGSSKRSDSDDPADGGAGPAVVALEAERRGRQVLLLSDVLREFTRWCESRTGGFRMKELYERRLRGQSPSTIMEAMQISRAAYDQSLKRARTWILERVKQQDVHRSVFQTVLVGRQQEPIEVQVPFGAVTATFSSFDDVVAFAVEEMGALCPSPERLDAYLRTPDAAELADIRYHVEETGCRMCQTPEV